MAFVSRRYLLFQIPGWILAILLLAAAHRWLGLSFPLATILFLLFVAKDFLIYPYVRKSYEAENKTGAELLIGSVGVAKQTLDPEGYVQVRGELWQARTELGGEPIPQGSEVLVRGADGLRLVVRRAKDE